MFLTKVVRDMEHTEENRKLLFEILNKRYSNNPEKLSNINCLIVEYTTSFGTKQSYEKVLKVIYKTIGDDIPENIVLYFLATIPLPSFGIDQIDFDSDLSNLVQKSKVALPVSGNTDVCLRKYLNDLITVSSLPDDTVLKEENKIDKKDVVPQKKRRRNRKNKLKMDGCQTLLDTCAQFVVSNFNHLDQFYETKCKNVWNVLNENPCQDDTQICFEILKDLNKKRKWLRMIDFNDISTLMLKDEFRETYSEMNKKEMSKMKNNLVAFDVSEQLKNSVEKYINS